MTFELVSTGAGLCSVDGLDLLLLDLPHPDVGALVRDTGSLTKARTAPVLRTFPLHDVDSEAGGMRCPVSPPVNVWGVGLNYRGKAAKAGRDIPTDPILYLKPANALAHPGAELPIPPVDSQQLDYEAELVIMIGRSLQQVGPDEAWSAVVGVTAGNDMSARDVMVRTGNPTLAKGFPSFCPLGPSVMDIAGRDEDLGLQVRSWVNGEPRQDGCSDDFIFAVSDLLSRLSYFTRLEAGDVLYTGTPPGTGQDLDSYLTAGDEITVRVGDLVPLTNRLAAANTTQKSL